MRAGVRPLSGRTVNPSLPPLPPRFKNFGGRDARRDLCKQPASLDVSSPARNGTGHHREDRGGLPEQRRLAFRQGMAVCPPLVPVSIISALASHSLNPQEHVNGKNIWRRRPRGYSDGTGREEQQRASDQDHSTGSPGRSACPQSALGPGVPSVFDSGGQTGTRGPLPPSAGSDTDEPLWKRAQPSTWPRPISVSLLQQLPALLGAARECVDCRCKPGYACSDGSVLHQSSARPGACRRLRKI